MIKSTITKQAPSSLDLLVRLGLTKTEAAVYTCLAKLGTTKAGALVKKTELHRATVYDVLQRLVEKALVKFITKEKTKHFMIESPSRLIELREEERERLDQEATVAQEAVAAIQGLQMPASDEYDASVFVGKQGVKHVMNLLLEEKETCTFGSHGRFAKVMGKDYFEWFRDARIKKGQTIRMLLSERMRSTTLPAKQRTRFLPESFDSPSSLHIAKNYVLIIVWNDVPGVVMIKNKDVAQSFMHYFETLWLLAKE